MELNGVLIIDKPVGMTSHDVVAKVRRLVGKGTKVGHLGTLDPLATGVLPLVIGRATKFANQIAGDEKTYEFNCCFGEQRDTDDEGGKIILRGVVPADLIKKIEDQIPFFLGLIDQRPPSFSAVKVKGRKLYEIARSGESVGLPIRKVYVKSLTILSHDNNIVRMKMECSKGTYVRSVCRDIGEKIGCGAYASQIRRLRSGPFTIDTAVGLEFFVRDVNPLTLLRAKLINLQSFI